MSGEIILAIDSGMTQVGHWFGWYHKGEFSSISCSAYSPKTSKKPDSKQLGLNCQRVHRHLLPMAKLADVICVEIIAGSQSARSAKLMGMGYSAACCFDVPLELYHPKEIKRRTALKYGHSTDKKGMIEFAASMFKDVDWSGPLYRVEHAADSAALAFQARISDPRFIHKDHPDRISLLEWMDDKPELRDIYEEKNGIIQ